jgi:hypothetical protein
MAAMRIVIWVVEGTWEGCVDAALARFPADSVYTLLHVTPSDVTEAAARMRRWSAGVGASNARWCKRLPTGSMSSWWRATVTIRVSALEASATQRGSWSITLHAPFSSCGRTKHPESSRFPIRGTGHGHPIRPAKVSACRAPT